MNRAKNISRSRDSQTSIIFKMNRESRGVEHRFRQMRALIYPRCPTMGMSRSPFTLSRMFHSGSMMAKAAGSSRMDFTRGTDLSSAREPFQLQALSRTQERRGPRSLPFRTGAWHSSTNMRWYNPNTPGTSQRSPNRSDL